MRTKTKNVLNKEDYRFGTPTQLDRPVKTKKREEGDHPWRVRKGFKLVRINRNTWIEIPKRNDEERARQKFIKKMERAHHAYYNEMNVTMQNHLR